MWLDQLETDAVQAQETEGNLAQQYQVSVYVGDSLDVCVQFKLGTLGTDAPIISLISGITQWGSSSSRHTFSLAYCSKPRDTSSSMWGFLIFFTWV